MTTQPEKDLDYYSLLNCDQSATYEELKQSYQQLIRKYHPDKNADPQEHFLNIDKAWKTLRSNTLRAEYDKQLQLKTDQECGYVIYAELGKDLLEFHNEETAEYPCRCGGSFVIDKEYLVEKECLVTCNDCSNCILIK